MTLDKEFEETFGKYIVDLILFRESHGKDAFPCDMNDEVVHNFRECDLFHWNHRMQDDYDNLKRGLESKMTDKHVKVLDELHFPWTRSQKDRWNGNFKNGHWNIPLKGCGIKQWVQRQRFEYRKYQNGEKANITKERIMRLDLIGFVWDPANEAWNIMYKELQEYAKIHHDCLVPRRYRGSGPQHLGSWVNFQHARYKSKNNNSKASTITDEIRNQTGRDGPCAHPACKVCAQP